MKPLNRDDVRKISLSLVREIGMNIPQDAEDELIETIHNRLRWDPETRRAVALDEAGNPMVTVAADGNVVDLSPKELIAKVASKFDQPKARKPNSSGSASSKPKNMTEQMLALKANRKAEAKKLAAEAAAKGNPWSTKTLNVTRQHQISIWDADLAARLKTEPVR